MNGAAPGHTTIPPRISRGARAIGAGARERTAAGANTAALPGRISLTAELDAATVKSAEWQQGGARVSRSSTIAATSPPVQLEQYARARPDAVHDCITRRRHDCARPLRRSCRAQSQRGDRAAADNNRRHRAGGGMAGCARVAWSRGAGPSTGLAYVATADARFRRTERIRLEVPRASGEGTASARLLGRDGLPLNGRCAGRTHR